MIIARIHGGLGNQLFQYAAAKRLALLHKTELKLDISYYSQPDCYRKFMLDEFSLNESVASADEISKYKKYRSNILLRLINGALPINRKRHLEESALPKFGLLAAGGDAYLDGYWQSDRYFSDTEHEIRSALRLPAIGAADQASSGSVSIHIRRGDYLSSKHSQNFNLLGLDYYDRAVNLINDRLKSPQFIVFTDDPAWVKDCLKISQGFRIASDGRLTDLQEFGLMASCSHNIIGNSTFSWWAAWLNPNPDKIIIAPSKWYVSDKFDANGLLPDDWIKI